MAEIPHVDPEIRDDMAIPDNKGGGPRGPQKWGLFQRLKVGQSALWTFGSKDELVRFRNTLSSNAHRYGQKLDRVFSVRTLEPTDDGLFQVGVWRMNDDGSDPTKD